MSAIKSYTDLEQSKKLAEILPLESADNVIVLFGSSIGAKTVVMPEETLDIIRTPFSDIRETTMCWSLSALLGVLPKGTNISTPKPINELGYCCWNQYDEIYAVNPVDACVAMIEYLHKLNLL